MMLRIRAFTWRKTLICNTCYHRGNFKVSSVNSLPYLTWFNLTGPRIQTSRMISLLKQSLAYGRSIRYSSQLMPLLPPKALKLTWKCCFRYFISSWRPLMFQWATSKQWFHGISPTLSQAQQRPTAPTLVLLTWCFPRLLVFLPMRTPSTSTALPCS